jgi:RNA polymerase sigma-70 factor (ECF subfamily)
MAVLFERIYREHYKDVLRFVLRRASADEAQDIVAETFVVVWRRLDDLAGSSRPWIFGIARKVLANHRRAAVRQADLAARAASLADDSSSAARDPGPDSRILAALRRLPPREREAIMLTAWEQLTAAEAAQVAECSAVAFRVRLHRARRRLESELADHRAETPRDVDGHSPPRELRAFPKEAE